MWLNWLPWKFLLRHAAKAHGFIDPTVVLAKIRSFSQPSEVQEPVELVRAGVVFQARGLINTRVIQFNLDWVWPFWVEKQFNPSDPSFLPRAYSLTHVNLTQRNWTAVGQPGLPLYPLIDPRGLATPHYDGWSIDCWILTSDERTLLPSKCPAVQQRLLLDGDMAVETKSSKGDLELTSKAWMTMDGDMASLKVSAEGRSTEGGWLVMAVRPYNAEGIQFIEEIAFDPKRNCYHVDEKATVCFDEKPERVLFSNFDEGDVFHKLSQVENRYAITCPVGLANAAALFPLKPGVPRRVEARVPLGWELEEAFPHVGPPSQDWASSLRAAARLSIPDRHMTFLYEAALRTLVLLSAQDIYPGPYSYRRFWFRDACIMLNALLSVGLLERSRRQLNSFPERQSVTGYFRSQNGEWDSNGQVLWIMERYVRLSGERPPASWLEAMTKGARWIKRKRVSNAPGTLHQGLLPAGFSAEHLGPNDYYYWDDFWGLAGLRAAVRMTERFGRLRASQEIALETRDFEEAIFRSLETACAKRPRGAIPAAPYRRMDAGAVGSMVADYPLQLFEPKDPRIMATCEWLMNHSFHGSGFFQEMVHSGINCYLTLALAQTLLRAGDERFQKLIQAMAVLASPTGQWPEATHPFSGGGCMGDGQHGWAAAEWAMMIRNLFVREEKDGLIVGSGLFPEWLHQDQPLSFGPTPTPFGPVEVRLEIIEKGWTLLVKGEWREDPPWVEARVPGYARVSITEADQPQKLTPS
jgi:hypothetical protein